MIRALLIMLTLTGCVAHSNIQNNSPIGKMMDADARGEKACVRNGVLVKNCR